LSLGEREIPARVLGESVMHELKLMDKLLTDFIAAFRHIAETGRMADIQLEQDKKIARLKKAGIR